MKVYLIKEDGTTEEFDNVIEFDGKKIVCMAGKGKMTVFAGENEYFTIKKENN